MYVCVFLCGYVHTECRSLQRPGAAGPLAEGVTESYELPDVDARGLLEETVLKAVLNHCTISPAP